MTGLAAQQGIFGATRRDNSWDSAGGGSWRSFPHREEPGTAAAKKPGPVVDTPR